MPSTFDALLSAIISRATSEIAAAIRDNMSGEVLRAVTAQVPGVAGVGRKPAVAPVAARKQAKRERRTAVQVTRDDWILLEYVRAHTGQRGEEILKGAGLSKERVTSGLQRLRR